MTFSNLDSPFASRYGSAEMRALWSDALKRLYWRRIWVALAEAQALAGVVTPEQAADLKANADKLDVNRSLEIEKEIGHDLMAEVKAFAEQIRPFVPRRYTVLGTDGFGRSDTREKLRYFFEVDRHWVTLASLAALAEDGAIERQKLADAIRKYGIDPEKPNPLTV